MPPDFLFSRFPGKRDVLAKIGIILKSAYQIPLVTLEESVEPETQLTSVFFSVFFSVFTLEYQGLLIIKASLNKKKLKSL